MIPSQCAVDHAAERALSNRLYAVLAGMLAMMLCYGIQALAQFSHTALWAFWCIFWLIMYRVQPNQQLMELIRPALPLIIWLVLYYLWGAIVSPVPVVLDAVRQSFFVLTVLVALTITLSRHEYLATFANAAQVGLVVNLIIMLLMANTSWFQDFLISRNLIQVEEQLKMNRFAGLWGNANVAAYVSLLIIILSTWSKPWLAWIGRASGVAILYMTASRTGTWILVFMLLHALFVVVRQKRSRLPVVITATLLFCMSICAGSIIADSALQRVDNPNISRVVDITESRTRDKGADSRVDVLLYWKPFLEKAPWYGYGLNAMMGGVHGESTFRSDLPPLGIHNLYLGIWLDIGVIGMITFLIVIGSQLFKSFRIASTVTNRWAVFSLSLLLPVFSLFNHNMLSSIDGIIGYILLFLLPASPAIFSGRAGYSQPLLVRRSKWHSQCSERPGSSAE